MVLTYPICFFVCRQVLHNLLSPRASVDDLLPDVRSISLYRHLAYTLAIFLSSVSKGERGGGCRALVVVVRCCCSLLVLVLVFVVVGSELVLPREV